MFPSYQIIIVDDDSDDRQLIIEAFSLIAPDLSFGQAFDGQHAIELLDSVDTAPSMIIVDLNMPVMNGLEMIRHIGSQQSQTPIVLMSTSLDSDTVKLAMSVGATCCYIKPVNYQELCSLAHQLLRRFVPQMLKIVT
ncbi:response regulator [Dyadobacter jiangsuensis]